ncbi:hypothetical protein Holit_00281 [Hollandina sp. SP2]
MSIYHGSSVIVKQTIEQLAVRKLFSQMIFVTKESLSFLRFTGYREIAPWKH